MLGADDSLDVFGVHGVGGIVGALLTGVFIGRPGAGLAQGRRLTPSPARWWMQAEGVLITMVWSGVVAFIAYKVVDMMVGLRVSEEAEREGLDITVPRRNGLQPLSPAGLAARCGPLFNEGPHRAVAEHLLWKLNPRGRPARGFFCAR